MVVELVACPVEAPVAPTVPVTVSLTGATTCLIRPEASGVSTCAASVGFVVGVVDSLTSVLADAGWLPVLGVEAVLVLAAVRLPDAAGVTVLATVLATVDVTAPTTEVGEALTGAELPATSEGVPVLEATAGSALDDGAEPAVLEEIVGASAAGTAVEAMLLAA